MRVIDFFDQGAALYPDNVAFHDLADGANTTYAEALGISHKVASALLLSVSSSTKAGFKHSQSSIWIPLDFESL